MFDEAVFANENSDHYQFGLRISERGFVQGVGDGIALVSGLPTAEIEEIIEFEDGSSGLVFQLGVHSLGVVLLSQTHELTAGMQAYRTRKRLQIGVGESLLGRVIDPLGNSLDGLPKPHTTNTRPLEASSPTILERDFVSKPLYTGNKIVDAMIPIGKGQRQLIVGDNGVGKSSFALDVVINQRNRNVYCVIVLVGQTRSSIASTVDILRHYDALEYTVIVVAEANALPGFRYLAPFSGCAIAEHWMRMGHDTLILYDDLTLHAQSYRELSLLLQRPPGREAYPSDIFYLHSRLLERSTMLAPEQGGGSMTAFPIVETRLGEISSYIPTNLISITDGQIYFDSKLFAAGSMPAIDIGRSVSRIGGKAQHPAIKSAAARIRLDYLQFLELELFARFGTRLEESVQKKLKRGRILRDILKQDRLSPLPEQAHLAWLLAYEEGFFEDFDSMQIAKVLPKLYETIAIHGLSLEDPKERWATVLQKTLTMDSVSHEPQT